MANTAFMQRGRTAAVQMAPPAATDRSSSSSSRPGLVREAGDEISEAFTGRLSLLALNSLVLGLVVFYLWTRGSQGGG
jgi:hypothetical protein